ncbi:hypothetical protein P7937_06090, partial [Staphylococcus aureus]|nr:hypothetical protein [Staphylococcus aureus]
MFLYSTDSVTTWTGDISGSLSFLTYSRNFSFIQLDIDYKWFFIFYGGKVKLPAFFNTQKAQLPL